MTCLTDISSISLTANAIKVGHTKGTNLSALLINAQSKTQELQRLLAIIETFHPSMGGDATNAASLAAISSELT